MCHGAVNIKWQLIGVDSSSTIWVLEIKPRSLSLLANTFTHRAVSRAFKATIFWIKNSICYKCSCSLKSKAI